MIDVTAIGEALIDFTQQGESQEGFPVMAAHPGGAPANFLAAMSALGSKTALLAQVGRDMFGDKLIANLKEHGIDTRGVVQTDEAFTTLAFVALDSQGDRRFSFARKPGADTCLKFEDIPLCLIDSARALHFGTLSLTDMPMRDATQKAVSYAQSRGKLLSFDPNLRQTLWDSLDRARDSMLWGLRHADVVKISGEEVEFLFGCDEVLGARKLTEEYGVKLCFVTLGKEGCYFDNGGARGHVAAYICPNTIDTTGAGDIFGGTALHLLLREEGAPGTLNEQQLRRLASYACAAASLSTSMPGGITSVPTSQAVERFMKTAQRGACR